MLFSALLSLYTFICPMKHGRIDNSADYQFFTGSPIGVTFLSEEPGVFSISDGTIILIPENPVYKGILVRENNIWVCYIGMDSIDVVKGASVCKGEKLGTAKLIDSSTYRITIEVWEKGSTASIPKKELHFLCE